MRAVEDSNTIDRRGLVALYVLYQLTWTIAMFYAWPEGYRLPPIAPPAPAMIQIASCLFFAAALFGDQLVVRILLASAYAAMAFEGGVVALARDGEIELDMVLFPSPTSSSSVETTASSGASCGSWPSTNWRGPTRRRRRWSLPLLYQGTRTARPRPSTGSAGRGAATFRDRTMPTSASESSTSAFCLLGVFRIG